MGGKPTEDLQALHLPELSHNFLQAGELVALQHENLQLGEMAYCTGDVFQEVVLKMQLRDSKVVTKTVDPSQLQ